LLSGAREKVSAGYAAKAVKAASDEYFQSRAAPSQVSRQMTPMRGETARITPKPVAAPFPPLKPRQERGSLAAGAQHVRGPDIAAAHGPNVDAQEHLREEQPERNGADEIGTCDNYYDQINVHDFGLRAFSILHAVYRIHP